MSNPLSSLLYGVLVLGLVGGCPDTGTAQTAPPTPEEAPPSHSTKEAPYVPTPQHVVLRTLELADVTQDDIVYDLGSGDGRFVITAAKEFGARGVGIEIDPELVELARNKAQMAGVEDRVEFRQMDLFEADISEATVVTMYLWPTMNERLQPKLKDELRPGTRVLSHDFNIEGWAPDTTVSIGNDTLHESANKIYFWTIPE